MKKIWKLCFQHILLTKYPKALKLYVVFVFYSSYSLSLCHFRSILLSYLPDSIFHFTYGKPHPFCQPHLENTFYNFYLLAKQNKHHSLSLSGTITAYPCHTPQRHPFIPQPYQKHFARITATQHTSTNWIDQWNYGSKLN